MKTHRLRSDSTHRLRQLRWWGCVLLAMFAVVQTARGSVEPAARPEPAATADSRALAPTTQTP